MLSLKFHSNSKRDCTLRNIINKRNIYILINTSEKNQVDKNKQTLRDNN